MEKESISPVHVCQQKKQEIKMDFVKMTIQIHFQPTLHAHKSHKANLHYLILILINFPINYLSKLHFPNHLHNYIIYQKKVRNLTSHSQPASQPAGHTGM